MSSLGIKVIFLLNYLKISSYCMLEISNWCCLRIWKSTFPWDRVWKCCSMACVWDATLPKSLKCSKLATPAFQMFKWSHYSTEKVFQLDQFNTRRENNALCCKSAKGAIFLDAFYCLTSSMVFILKTKLHILLYCNPDS